MSKNISKYKILLICLFSIIHLPSANGYSQGFVSIAAITDYEAKKSTADKPQSKVWKHDGYWWAVIPDSLGTHICKLVDNNWVRGHKLSSIKRWKADTKNVGDTTYILLFEDDVSKIVTVEYAPDTETYSEIGRTNISTTGVETATIDIDSQNRMWLAYQKSNDIKVQYSDPPYSSWSSSIDLETSVDSDDICAVVAFEDDEGKKIGVMWSDQDEDRFGFAYHLDGDDPEASNWTMEIPIYDNNVPDDHINFAVASNGTLYAAVKTSYNVYNDDLKPQLALLVRRPSGSWEFHGVRNWEAPESPSRPIALLDETNGKITIVYTSNENGGDIMYKTSSTSSIDFSPGDGGTILIPATSDSTLLNNTTSTKQCFDSEVVILASAVHTWRGVIGSYNSPTPVELSYFAGTINGNHVELHWGTETEVNNYGFEIERSTNNSDWLRVGFVKGHGNTNSPKQYSFFDSEHDLAGNYYYRLKQIDNDGTIEYSNIVIVEIGVPDNFNLSQNYPNPFNPETRIDFSLPQKQMVKLSVYNTLGEQMAELLNEEMDAGSYTIKFDASSLPSGIYIYRLLTQNYILNKKMTLLK